jgi:hypothetical protein
MPRDDSGLIPLTRDGGYRMIQEAVKEFEGNVWGPAVRTLTVKVEENDKTTNEILTKITGVSYAVRAVGIIVSVLSGILVVLEILKLLKTH